MKQSELQKSISQLCNVTKSFFFFFACKLVTVRCSEQSNKTHNFRKIILVTYALANNEQTAHGSYTFSCPRHIKGDNGKGYKVYIYPQQQQ